MQNKFTESARYHQGEMTPEEREIFEKKLSDSPEWKEKSALFLTVKDVLKDNSKEAVQELDLFKENLNKARTAYRAENFPVETKKTFAWKWIAVAAIFILLFVGGALWLFNRTPNRTHKVTPEILYAQNFPPSVINPAMGGTGADWIANYEKGDFTKTIETLSAIPNGERNTQERAALIDCYTKLNNYNEALSEISKLDNQLYADWLTAGLYLKQKKVQEAKVLLEKLAEGNSMFKGRAKRILEEI